MTNDEIFARIGSDVADAGNGMFNARDITIWMTKDLFNRLCQEQYVESYSVIAKAFRNNPKDLVLREYMMKNACCCEAEEDEI